MAQILVPIWRDCIHVIAQSVPTPFQVRVSDPDTGAVIYSGVTSPRPGETDCRIRLNDIFADYLSHALPTLSDTAFSDLTFPLDFYVSIYTGGAWSTEADYYTVLADWSYDPAYDVTTMGMAFPVLDAIVEGQWLMFTGYDVATIQVRADYPGGGHETLTVPIAISADFDQSFNIDFSRGLRAAGSGTAVFDLSGFTPGMEYVTIISGGLSYRYRVLSGCDHRYVLYYLNAFGGWDTLALTGNCVRADSLERHENERAYDNRSTQNRGRVNYANVVTWQYTFRTGLLTDAQSERMWNLLGSTDVYLHDLVTDEIRPIVLKDGSYDRQTFKGNGGRFAQYTFTGEVAQIFERR